MTAYNQFYRPQIQVHERTLQRGKENCRFYCDGLPRDLLSKLRMPVPLLEAFRLTDVLLLLPVLSELGEGRGRPTVKRAPGAGRDTPDSGGSCC